MSSIFSLCKKNIVTQERNTNLKNSVNILLGCKLARFPLSVPEHIITAEQEQHSFKGQYRESTQRELKAVHFILNSLSKVSSITEGLLFLVSKFLEGFFIGYSVRGKVGHSLLCSFRLTELPWCCTTERQSPHAKYYSTVLLSLCPTISIYFLPLPEDSVK